MGCLVQNAAVRFEDRLAAWLIEGLVVWLAALRLVDCQNGRQIGWATGGLTKYVADC